MCTPASEQLPLRLRPNIDSIVAVPVEVKVGILVEVKIRILVEMKIRNTIVVRVGGAPVNQDN